MELANNGLTDPAALQRSSRDINLPNIEGESAINRTAVEFQKLSSISDFDLPIKMDHVGASW
jgi:hypothetical protein